MKKSETLITESIISLKDHQSLVQDLLQIIKNFKDQSGESVSMFSLNYKGECQAVFTTMTQFEAAQWLERIANGKTGAKFTPECVQQLAYIAVNGDKDYIGELKLT